MALLLPTELIGSYALPGWLLLVRERIEEHNDMGETDLAEALDDAVNLALAEQEQAGLDILTDGEMRRRDFIQSFYDRLTGLRKLAPARSFGAAGYDQNPRYEVIDRVTAPRGLGIVAEAEYLKKACARPFKICVPGPLTLALPMVLKSGYENKARLLEDVAAIINVEMKALVAAGVKYMQVDEPRFSNTGEDTAALVDLFNATTAGVQARVGLHVCFGNFMGRSRDRRDYSQLFPVLLDARCDQFNLEFANREFFQLELLKKFRPDQRIGLGVIDVKSYYVETPDEVAASIRRALQFAAPEAIVVTPDCGFNHCPRHIAQRKMLSLVRGAAIVREELAAKA